MTSADSDRYGLRPRLATLTAMRPPGSSTRTHSAKTVSQHVEVVDVGRRDVALAERLFVLLAGEVRRRRDDQGDGVVGDARSCRGVAGSSGSIAGSGRRTVVVVGELGRREAGVEGGRVVALAPADAEVRGPGRPALTVADVFDPTRGGDSAGGAGRSPRPRFGPDLEGASREVQRVQVQARGAAVEQALAELRAHLDGELPHPRRVAVDLVEPPLERRRDGGAVDGATSAAARSTLTKDMTPGSTGVSTPSAASSSTMRK